MTIGYTTGVFDLFHIGHLNMLRNAKGLCDKLIVGVARDEIVTYKSRKVIIPFEERIEIVRNIKCVDVAIPQDSIELDYKFEMWKKLHFNVIFTGDDWYGVQRWTDLEEKFKTVGVKLIYYPYTQGTSSTLINKALSDLLDKN